MTSEFLPRVLEEIDNGQLFADTNGRKDDKQDRLELQGYLHGLLPGLKYKKDHELPLITDLFSLVEHAIAAGETLPIGSDDTLRRCCHLLKQAITDILVGDFLADWDDEDPNDQLEKRTLRLFSHWVWQNTGPLGIVTTNYDIGLEYEIYQKLGNNMHQRLDLGFDWREVGSGRVRTRPSDPRLRLYKLHGSLDLLRCSLCGHVYFNPYGVIALQPFMRKLNSDNSCVCSSVRLKLHIVPPSFVREMYEANLLSIWRSAFEWLRTAKRWVIVGYSLPPEDLAVRSLLMRAYATAQSRPRIIVVQRTDVAKSRYELLFPGCRYVTGGLERFLARELKS